MLEDEFSELKFSWGFQKEVAGFVMGDERNI